jgi:prepilin-type N-terminal cleavage/methylation domain-containing protein
MTLTELMVVLVIIGILSALALPSFRGDRVSKEGRTFASEVARELQRARYKAVAERLPMRAFVYSDRVEFRSAVAGATPTEAPRAATVADPVERVVQARENVRVYDVVPAMNPPGSAALGTASYKIVEFNTLGAARLVGVVGGAIFAYVRNDDAKVAVTDGRFRIGISPLTGAVSLAEVW